MRILQLAVLLALCVCPSFALAEGLQTSKDWKSSGAKTADALIKTGTGVVHTVTCSSDAAATAGVLDIRDGVAAAGGTLIQSITFIAAYFPPVTIILDQPFFTGLYLDFTTTADVTCSASYR